MRSFYVVVFSFLLALGAQAQQVQLKGLFGDSALLEVDGRQRILKAGQKSPEGITLLEATTRYARVSIEGREQKLTLEAPIAASFAQAARAEVRLAADSRGHYMTDAWVNGLRVPMMVDTGATSIAFNYPTARRLGLNLNTAEEIRVSTANGITRAYRLNLNSVTIGGIKLHNVDATVHADDFPSVVLLGNSFLSRVDMEQQQGVLLLRARH
ncbi:TIGR02281 family clan AA aspartic protease [Microbulbifer sp. OS29]|uniref:TIGR02281 family clan AA aspartic protease n=1 Tax=Microbulbifer okhotskensis TaxID=2926617 RepID=A0A9X2EL12_9GAMM|nr:TIGR02281 family clan AA aspartic protease [Microbulbifer okhotskensis]MCO1333594.1 TIGR02281 family clan AA aspartic protease [Microbulbifer okhotskensis]